MSATTTLLSTYERRCDSPSTSTESLRERIEVIDALRGFALLGMFAVHFADYVLYPTAAPPGRGSVGFEPLRQVMESAFEGRFYAIFGALFGVGFAIQLHHATAHEGRFAVRYLRRLAALAVFGFIAEGIFGYNVLLGYALWGVPLLLLRRWSLRALVALLVLSAASAQLVALGRMAVASTRPGGVEALVTADRASAAAYAAATEARYTADQSSSWRTAVAGRLRFMPTFHRRWTVFPNGSFTLFLLGLIGFRLGLFDRPENRRLIAAVIAGGLVSWALATWVFAESASPSAFRSGDWPVLHAAVTMARENGFRLVRAEWLGFAYAGVVLLLVARDRAWMRRLAPFTWTGRMALTCYMLQVVFLEVVFSNQGLGIRLPAWGVLPAAVALFAVQALGAHWWLRRYRYGPLEWLWRSATYWRVQSMRHV